MNMERLYGGLWNVGEEGDAEICADDGFGNLVKCPVWPMIEWLYEDFHNRIIFNLEGFV